MLKKALESIKYDSKSNTRHDEFQYINLIRDILSDGYIEDGRNGLTTGIFGSAMHFSLENNILPLLTTKKVAWKTCLKELLWFISGKTDNAILNNEKVHIWDANASRDYLNSRGLHNLMENDLGPVYGHQWRYFNAPYDNCRSDYSGQGVDQLQYIIDSLINPETRNSRRLILSSWNPCQINKMALPPCHVLIQFNVFGGNKLSCSLYQRSGDVGLGVPFNIASYCFLTHLIAHHCGLIAHEFVYNIGNAHIYDDHLEPLEKQTDRIPYCFPQLIINNKHANINEYCVDDFSVLDYNYHPPIKMKMRT